MTPSDNLPPAPSQPSASRARRILIVDDSVDAAWALATLLELSGHETHTAHDGTLALAKAAEVRPDAILLDLGLPGISGFEVCRQIREQPWGSDMVIIAVTGWGRDTDREKSRAAGFNHHVVKPIDPESLAKVLDAMPMPNGSSSRA